MRAEPWRSAPPPTSVRLTLALSPAVRRGLKPVADQRRERELAATSAGIAATAGAAAGRASAAPISAPITPPATAGEHGHDRAPRAAATPVQAIGIQTCDQPHSAARPTVPISDAGRRRRTPAAGARGASAGQLDARPPRPTYSGKCGSGLAEHRADDQADRRRGRRRRRRRRRARRRGPTTAGRQPAPRRRRARSASARRRVGTAGRRSRTRPGRSRGRSGGRPPARRAGTATTRAAQAACDSPRAAALARRAAPRPAGPPGRSSVIAAPPISIRWVGPQSVTSWPKSRCQKSSSGKPTSENAPQASDQHAADGRVPVAGDAHGAGPGRSRGAGTIARKPAAKMPNRPARIR